MSRPWPLFLLFAALILARPALAGDVARDDLPRTLFERQYKVLYYHDHGTQGGFLGSAAMADGGIAVVGWMDHKRDGVARSNGWVLRFDSAGKLLWQREYRTPGHNITVFAAAGLADGGLLVAGQDKRVGSARQQGLVMRLDARGNLVWRRVVAPVGSLRLRGIAAAPDNGAVAVGIWEKRRDPAMESDGGLLVRLDGKGKLVWRLELPVKLGSHVDQVHAAGDGGFVVLGAATTQDKGHQATATAFGVAGDGKILWRQDFGPAGDMFDMAYTYAPEVGFAVMQVGQDKRTLTLSCWDIERRRMWSIIDPKIAEETKAKEFDLVQASILLGPDGTVSLVLATPSSRVSPRAPSALFQYDAAGMRHGSRPLEMPRDHYFLIPAALTPLGQGEIAIVGQTVHYTRNNYYPKSTNIWLRSFQTKN